MILNRKSRTFTFHFRVTEVPVKYVGRVVDDQFLVGYGLDLEERGRNLPEIYTLKYPN
jgi:hypoxanthine phosphoribosyltransferase